MFKHASHRLARRAAAVMAGSLLLGSAGAVIGIAAADALPKATVTVTPQNYESKSGSVYVYNPTDEVRFHINISPDKSGEKNMVELQRLVTGTWHDVYNGTDTIPTGSSYDFLGDHAAGGTYRFQSTYLGDTSNAKTASGWVNYRVTGRQTDIVQPTVDVDAAGGKKDGKYLVYKPGKTVAFTVKVSPNRKGEDTNAYAEKFVGGHWKALLKGTKALNHKSKAEFDFQNGKTNKKYRLRADYLGDGQTGRASSPWVYFTFEKK